MSWTAFLGCSGMSTNHAHGLESKQYARWNTQILYKRLCTETLFKYRRYKSFYQEEEERTKLTRAVVTVKFFWIWVKPSSSGGLISTLKTRSYDYTRMFLVHTFRSSHPGYRLWQVLPAPWTDFAYKHLKLTQICRAYPPHSGRTRHYIQTRGKPQTGWNKDKGDKAENLEIRTRVWHNARAGHKDTAREKDRA
jgi:hypothetical protein